MRTPSRTSAALAVTLSAILSLSSLAVAHAEPSDSPTPDPTASASTTARTGATAASDATGGAMGPGSSASATSSTPTETPTPTTPAFVSQIVYATKVVEVRSSASSTSSVIGTMQVGWHVGTRGPAAGAWTPVSFRGRAGWLPSNALSLTRPAPAPVTQIVYATRKVEVRSISSLSGPVIGTMQVGWYVGTRGPAVGAWMPVNFRGQNGWIPTNSLSTSKPSAPAPTVTKRIVWATTTVNVRSAASTSSSVLGQLQRGWYVGTRGNTVNGWVPVTYRGRSGWVSSQYVSTSYIAPTSSLPSPSTAPVKIDSRCRTGRAVCINKSERKLRLLNGGKVLITLDARFGDENNPTREGQFTIYWKNKDHVSTLYGSKMPYAMFFSGGEAIHYSSDFAARGYAGNSHGCVNIRSWSGIQYLWNNVPVGTKVVVYH
ncbi:L,D-transpeptidase family protein [Acidipropionibacterium timonense]|uniref:L,D-transpeptidase family protein n=1 Tax=Acidipropionibacterium timonense TaxID=2161818 RepID=UPI001FD8A18E|nr:L,D-transpeptidase family protein [Acidipropionibacterium timonense]